MTGLSPGVAYGCFNLLGVVGRHAVPFARMRAELPRQDKLDVGKIIELCQELSWLRANDDGVAVLTPRGARLAAAEGDPAKLRQGLLDYVEMLSPPWVKLAIDGRKKLLTFAPTGVSQCMVEAELATGYADEVVSFWDQLAAMGRGLRGAELTEIGRLGERLSLAFEHKRTGKAAKWRSVESNADGYDLLSVADRNDSRPVQIEVKASRRGLRGAMHLTRNEWDATQCMPLHRFHLWDVSTPYPSLAVVERHVVSEHVPADHAEGSWQIAEIPFSAFESMFARTEATASANLEASPAWFKNVCDPQSASSLFKVTETIESLLDQLDRQGYAEVNNLLVQINADAAQPQHAVAVLRALFSSRHQLASWAPLQIAVRAALAKKLPNEVAAILVGLDRGL
ncbi:MAG TPA: DUF3883 domain-containing protein [Hyphomonadaceae bacterium]|nr:DUF3883 domain-containing protein [Hyphomonadaceae bacterium]